MKEKERTYTYTYLWIMSRKPHYDYDNIGCRLSESDFVLQLLYDVV